MVSCSDNGGVTITWMGHSMFLIELYRGLRILTDPYSLETGYTFPHTEPDIVTISHYHHDHCNLPALGGSPEVIDKAGIYNYPDNEMSITGYRSYHDEVGGAKRGESIVFKFNYRGLILAHMGDYGQPLSEDHAEALKDVDVLLIPVGDTFTVGPIQAAGIVQRLKPKIVIPMHYRTRHYNREDVKTYVPFADAMKFIRMKGSSVYIEHAGLPEETEVWVMEYIQKSMKEADA
jgi:L-ascorbate metabolism protein UlaG (beta-lactamase superfamily)